MKIEIEEIKKIARLAGKEILKKYKDKHTISKKDGGSPVTEVDIAAQNIIEDKLIKYGFPILSEEGRDDLNRLKSDTVWVVDPLDGTLDFINKTGEFAVLIGLAVKQKPILGVIYVPVKDTFYFAEKGKGAFKQEAGLGSQAGKISRISCSKRNDFTKMTLVTSINHLQPYEQEFAKEARIGYICGQGSAGIKLAKVAEGEGDIYINSSRKACEWDTCAGEVILREAGGEITDLFGEKIKYNKENYTHIKGFLASNGGKHEEIIRILGKQEIFQD